MKIGDVSRPRRFADPARLRWYAYHRAVRFALRMHQADSRDQIFPLPFRSFAALFFLPNLAGNHYSRQNTPG